jgi:hypothetical protein
MRKIMERNREGKWARPADPTPLEIATQTALIRNNWTDEDFRQRSGADRRRGWQPPTGRVMLERRELYDLTR